ncbi:MAG TPA: CapA family protein [bacterium]|nr:CapA family protein [bacterium]
MRHAHALLGLSATLGIGLFIALFFLLPKPNELHIPTYFNVHLPLSEDRDAPLPSPAPEPQAVLSFVGDIMLARQVEQTIVEKGTTWPFARLDDLFLGSDLVIGNFEGTVREKRNIEVTNQMIFDTTPDNVPMLADAGFTHLSLANNHADDYGQMVTEATRETITAAGMTPFGDPFAGEKFITRENINGVSISIIGFHAFEENVQDILPAIEQEHAQGRFVIVYPHWGVEYATTAPGVETYPAQLFVNAGADLIIGAHPHVIQNIEIVDGTPVVYSLGNFLFDQDFSTNTKQGLTVQVTITEDTVDLHFTPIQIENRQSFPMEAEAANALLTQLGFPDGNLSVPRK